MRRRDFVAGFVGASAWSLVARAQQDERKKRIGVLISRPERDPEGQGYVIAA